MERECTVCKKPLSLFTMKNKRVCFRCDELTFDMEIELEEDDQPTVEAPARETVKTVLQLAKKV